MAGCKVAIGGRSTMTGEDGSFSIEAVSETYDAFIFEPDGSVVSIYYGATRRDPVFSHVPRSTVGSPSAPKASISGTISGEFSFPLESDKAIDIYFLSPSTVDAQWQIGNRVLREGPSYGPIGLNWSEPGSIDGVLVALGRVESPTDGHLLSMAVASQSVTLTEGQAVVADLALAPVVNGHLAGSVEMLDDPSLGSVYVTYHLPTSRDYPIIAGFRGQPLFDWEVPDLTGLGGSYCLTVGSSDGRVVTRQCGIAIGTRDLALTLPVPPKILNPGAGAPVTKDTKYSWTSVEKAVYTLDLTSASGTRPSTPRLSVHTTATELSWPDLSSIGLGFPAGGQYRCDVTAVSPRQSLDEGGLGMKDEGTSLRSDAIQVATVQ